MYRIATSAFKRVSGDEELTLFNLLTDIQAKHKSGCGIYFCPSDAFGLDTLGPSILVRKRLVIDNFIATVASELIELDTLVILGYLSHDSKQSCAVIRKGEVLLKTSDFSTAFIDSYDVKISIKDVNDMSSHTQGGFNILFLVGSRSVCSDDYNLLQNYIKFLSKETCSAVFYSTPAGDISSQSDVYNPVAMSYNYYEIIPAFNDGSVFVDTSMLLYHSSLVHKQNSLPSALHTAPIEKMPGSIRFPRTPLVDMERETIVHNYRLCAINIANRMLASGAKKLILGLSGGVDSASTAILASQTVEVLRARRIVIENSDVIAVSMPGLGTSAKTRQNSRNLSKGFGFTFYEIPIKRATESHFRDIKHDIQDKSVVYQNAQARERTQILLDMANKHSALQLGTSDLSEAVLGWCTFSGDQCAMYNTNLSFSKTQLQYILSTYSQMLKSSGKKSLAKVFDDILDTPITPELLPLGSTGEIEQRTEDSNGPYKVVDFLIYLYFYRGYDKNYCIRKLAESFTDFETQELIKWADNFERRFMHSHFKRATSSQAPIVTSIGKIVYNLDMTSAPMV